MELNQEKQLIVMKSAEIWWDFSLSFNSTKLHGNIFLNYYLASLADSPTCVIFLITLDRFGRKWNLVFFQVRPSFSPMWQPWNLTSPRSESLVNWIGNSIAFSIFQLNWLTSRIFSDLRLVKFQSSHIILKTDSKIQVDIYWYDNSKTW